MVYNENDYANGFKDKLIALIDNKYKDYNKGKRRKKFKEDFSKEYNIDLKKFDTRANEWLCGRNLASFDSLLKLCTFFDCDIEYLITKQEHFKKDTADVSIVTGLNYTTIAEITNLSLAEKHIVDAIFGRTVISTNLIKTIKEMLYYSHPMTKNQTCITLDNGLTMRDKDYKELENELNENEVVNILSYKLFLEMHNMIDDLSNDEQLTNEIKMDYEKKFFKPHKKILYSNELPKLTEDADGNVIFDIEQTIYDLETKIAERLKIRDMKNKTYDYKIENLCNYSDFEKLIQTKRTQESKESYLEWLRYIDAETK